MKKVTKWRLQFLPTVWHSLCRWIPAWSGRRHMSCLTRQMVHLSQWARFFVCGRWTLPGTPHIFPTGYTGEQTPFCGLDQSETVCHCWKEKAIVHGKNEKRENNFCLDICTLSTTTHTHTHNRHTHTQTHTHTHTKHHMHKYTNTHTHTHSHTHTHTHTHKYMYTCMDIHAHLHEFIQKHIDCVHTCTPQKNPNKTHTCMQPSNPPKKQQQQQQKTTTSYTVKSFCSLCMVTT